MHFHIEKFCLSTLLNDVEYYYAFAMSVSHVNNS